MTVSVAYAMTNNETIIHLFVHCERAKTFFGHISHGDLFIPLNAIHMAAKMYIFECARSRSRLTVECFCNYMRHNIFRARVCGEARI